MIINLFIPQNNLNVTICNNRGLITGKIKGTLFKGSLCVDVYEVKHICSGML